MCRTADISGLLLLRQNLGFLYFRPLCENPLNAKWEKTEEKENDDKEEHSEPLLQ